MSDKNGPTLEALTSLAKRRGFVFPASEIYGGLAGFYDYGPYGAQMTRNIKDAWWDTFVRSVPNIYGIDSAIIQNTSAWKASGHVDGFNDPMVEDTVTHKRYRADHLAEVDSNDLKELNKLLKGKKSPEGNPLGEVKSFNMMFKSEVGSTGGDDATVYLRPEIAGAMFTNFEQVRETTRAKLPFGIAQIGKSFRNEISPRDFLFRLREFEMMELEYFVYPAKAKDEYKNMKQICWDWLKEVGLDESKMSWHQHSDEERAHYASDSWDINYAYPFGEKELWGIANRTDYDLKAHAKASGKDLTYFDPEKNKHLVPFVIEPSIGVSRLMLALMHSAYKVEKVGDEERTVLKLRPGIAPVDVAILPLSKKQELTKPARELYQHLVRSTDLNVEYDETQSIGKRYRRQDEIGTPKCITVDFESIEDKKVTVRDRDTMEQKRVPMDSVQEALAND